MDRETKVTMKENLILEALHRDIEVPCPRQVALLWFSAPTNLNRKFANNGTTMAKFRDTVSSAIELRCNIAFDVAHTPRECLSRAVTILVLREVGCARNRPQLHKVVQKLR